MLDNNSNSATLDISGVQSDTCNTRTADYSASSVGRLVGCPTSFALPQSRTTGEYAVRGNIIHAYCRLLALNPDNRDAALAAITDEKIRATCAGIDLTETFSGITPVAYERAYVLNVKDRTVRVVGDNIERKYGELGLYDVPCTIDFIGMEGEVPVETDYKSGQYIGEPEVHWQRRVCAIALMIHYGTATAKSRVAYIKEDGQIFLDGCEFSCLDIDDMCDEVVTAIDSVMTAKTMLASRQMPATSPSDDNCKYCPAFSSCPSQVNLAKAMGGDLEAIESGPDLRTFTSEQMGALWDKMKKYQKILERIEKTGKAMAQNEALIVDKDWEVRPEWQSGRMSFDASAARGLISVLLAEKGLDEAEIDDKIKSLKVKGADFAKFSKVKRAKQ